MRDASYKGVPFDWREMGRSVQHETQIRRFPNRVDSAGRVTAKRAPEVDQTSTGPREFKGVAVFTGADADTRASAFWDAVEAGGPGTFVHPVYGELQAVAETGDETREAGDRRYVAIEVRFIEDGRATIRPQAATSPASVAKRAFAAQATLTSRAEAAMAPLASNVGRAAAAAAAVSTCLDDAEGALQAVASPDTIQPVLAALRAMRADAASLVLAPAELASGWVATIEVLTPIDLLAAAQATRLAAISRADEAVAAVQDVLRDSAMVAACVGAANDPGATASAALDLARRVADESRACALLAATPEVRSAVVDVAGAAVAALQDASGALPRLVTIRIPAPISPLVLAGELYPDDPEAGALELIGLSGSSGLFVRAGTAEVARAS